MLITSIALNYHTPAAKIPWEIMIMFTYSSLLMVGFVKAENMEPEELVDVTTHVVTHNSLLVETFICNLKQKCVDIIPQNAL